MGRRRKTSPVEDMLDMVALLPWWAGVLIALFGYAVMGGFAAAAKPGPTQILTSTLASIGQVLFPVIGLIGAAMSFIRRKHRAGLVDGVALATSADALDGMSWRHFELLVGEAFRLQGYQVAEMGGAGPDGGIDLVLTRDGKKYFVQCKQWKTYKVGVSVVRELYGVMAANSAVGGFVVTSGRFTDDAKSFAKDLDVQLLDGPRLFAMIKQAKQSLQLSGQPPASQIKRAQTSAIIQPSCPLCSANMVRRTARKGTSAGNEFWGCSKFPACRGIRHIKS